MDRKINQHYVWKWYLNSWAISEQIYCLRNNAIFKTNTRNIASQREFYKIPVLNPEIEKALKIMFVDKANPVLKEMNETWINMFSLTSDAKKIFPENKLFDSLEENLYSEIENDLKPFVEELLKDNLDFLKDDNLFQPFIFSLIQQYFRTKKMSEMIEKIEIPSSVSDKNINMWPVVRHLFSTIVAFNIIAQKNFLSFIILKAKSGQRFIAGDQPLINLHATDKRTNEEIKDLKFYYPLSPSRALILELNPENKNILIEFAETDVIDYNNHIKKQSLESIFAQEEEDLIIYYEASHNKE